jgi:hypothetical protein
LLARLIVAALVAAAAVWAVAQRQRVPQGARGVT